MKFNPGDNLVSFDVVSVYTNIPIKKVLVVIYYLTDPETAISVEIYLVLTYFGTLESYKNFEFEHVYLLAKSSR